MVSKEMWVDWKNHPVTQYFLASVNEKREKIKEGIAEGQSGFNTNRDIGRAQGLKDVLQYALFDFDYVITQEDTNAQSGSVSSDSQG